MTGVELIVAALAAGAAAGAKDTAKTAVGDAYGALKGLLRHRLAGRDEAHLALDAAETEPEVWQTRLGADLADSGADRDAEVLAAATKLLEAADPDGVRASRYRVKVAGEQGAVFTGEVNATAHDQATAIGQAGTVNIGDRQRGGPDPQQPGRPGH